MVPGQQNRLACTEIAAGKAEAWYLRQHPDILDFKFRRGLKRPEKINAIEAFLRGNMTREERQVWEACFRYCTFSFGGGRAASVDWTDGRDCAQFRCVYSLSR